MIESCIKLYLYKIHFINKHVSSHVDDKVFKMKQTKFSVYFNQAIDAYNITFRQQMFKKIAKIIITSL